VLRLRVSICLFFPCGLDLICGWLDLKEIGEYDDTLIVVTADHGHGFVCDLEQLTRMFD